MSSESVTTLSKVVPLIMMIREDLKDQCSGFTGIARELTECLMDELVRRFPNLQVQTFWAGAAYLDPRFKKIVFTDEASVKKIQEKIQQSMRPVEDPSPPVRDMAIAVDSSDASEQPATKKTSIWDRLDKRIAGHLNKTPVGYININIRV